MLDLSPLYFIMGYAAGALAILGIAKIHEMRYLAGLSEQEQAEYYDDWEYDETDEEGYYE